MATPKVKDADRKRPYPERAPKIISEAALNPRTPEYLRIEARKHATAVIKRMVEILHGKDDRAAFMAGKELLDRGFGKAPLMAVPFEPGTEDGAAIQIGYAIIPAKAEP